MSDTGTTAVGVGRRMPRWLWALLVVSLALNLLLIGLMVGAAVFRHRWGAPVLAGASPFGFLRTLPRERREEIRQLGRERLTSMRPMWQQAREARREADRLFTTEPFEAERFVQAHHRMLDLEATARKAGSQLMAETGARLSLEERRQMLQWRDRHGRRSGRGGRGSPDSDQDPPDQPPEPRK